MEAHLQFAAARAAELRHRLHAIPELGFEEHQTAALVRAELAALGIPFVAGVAGAPTATIATLGDPSRPCIALRADIDALPIAEETGLPYTSTHPGRMHACGHDGHTAVLLGTLAVLKELASQLPVCVKAVFQPAEEAGGGAGVLCRAGVLDGGVGLKVQAIFGLHGWPGLAVGAVSTRPGPLLAGTSNFRVAFVGRGCHGAFPHLGRDPIATAAEAIVGLQQVVSRECDPADSVVVTVGIFHAGTATNIIPAEAIFEGTARTLNAQTYRIVRAALERRCRGVAEAGGCRLDFQMEPDYPPTVNDAAMAEYVERVARQTLGGGHYVPAAHPTMGGEDFAFYLRDVPGCFFFLGVAEPGAEVIPLHNSRYNFADAAIPVGIRMFVELVRGFPPQRRERD